MCMKWSEYKTQMTSLDQVDIKQIEIIPQLIQMRIHLGLTQQQLAEKAQLEHSLILQLEENAKVNLNTLEKVAKALAITI